MKKPEMFAVSILESCLAVCSSFHGNIGYIYYPAVVSVLVPIVEHSVKIQRHLLV